MISLHLDVIGAITGVKEAMDEIVDEKVGDAIYDAFSNPGGVPIDTVVSNFTDSIEEAGKGFSTISEKSNEMDNVQKNIQDTWIEITRIETAMDNGVLSVEEGKEKLAGLFGELATLTEQKFATMEQTVIAAYGEGGALHDALENIGVDTNAASTITIHSRSSCKNERRCRKSDDPGNRSVSDRLY